MKQIQHSFSHRFQKRFLKQSRHSTKDFQITPKQKTQSGRSMVEMLGVLAIIGVLSIGGVAAYRYAMEQIGINEALTIVEKFWMGYLQESEKEHSILYEATSTCTASGCGSPPVSSRRFSEYFCKTYIGGKCEFASRNNLINFTNNASFHYAVNPNDDVGTETQPGYGFELELFFSFPRRACEAVLEQMLRYQDMLDNNARIIYGGQFWLYHSTPDSIKSDCAKMGTRPEYEGNGNIGMGINFYFPAE